MDVYNPGFLKHDDPFGTHVCRRDLLNELLAKLGASGPTAKQKHFLIRSQSGMGKTNLVQQVNQYGLQKHETDLNWFPLIFPEDHFEICRLSDIWFQGLVAMVSYLRVIGYTRQAQTWDRVIKAYLLSIRCTQLTERRDRKIKILPPENDNTALQLFLESIHQFPKHAVLLIDNIHEMLLRIHSEHTAFFATVQHESSLQIVGTCSFALQDDYLRKASAHELFSLIDLERLDTSESLKLLHDYAEVKHRPDIVSELKQSNRKVNGLIDLAGGNPRTLLLLFPLLAEKNQDSPAVLAGILDRITPWYENRLRELSGPAQQMFARIALNREPMSGNKSYKDNHETMSRSRTALEELLTRKHIEPSRISCSSKQSYQVTEKLFSIWCSMRNRNRMRPTSEWLVLFLERFYDSSDLEDKARKQLLIPPSDEAGREFGFALARTIHKKHLAQALQFSILRFSAESDPGFGRTKNLLDVHVIDSKLEETIERMQNFAKIRKLIGLVNLAADINGELLFNHLLGSPSLLENEKIHLGENAHSTPPEHWRNLLGFLTHEFDQWRNLLKHHTIILYNAIGSGLMAALSDTEGAEIASELWQNPVIPAISFDVWLDSAIKPSREEINKIEAIYRLAIQFDGALPVLWRNLGLLQQTYSGQYRDAEFSLRRAIALDPDQALSWTYLGNLLKNFPGRLSESEKAYRQALEIEPANPNSYNNLAWFLYRFRLGYDEAVQLVHRALEMDPGHVYSFHTLATLLVRDNRWEEAVPYIQRFVRGLDRDVNRTAWKDILNLFFEIIPAGRVAETISVLEGCSDCPHWKALREVLATQKPDRPRTIDKLPSEVRDYAKKFPGRLNANRNI